MKHRRPFIYVFVGACALIGVVLVGATIRKSAKLGTGSTPQTLKETQVTATHLPLVSSSIKELEVVNEFLDAGRQFTIVVRNNSSKGVTGFMVSSGNYSLTIDEGLATDKPKILIQPKSNYTFQLPAEELRTTIPVILSGVIYSDGTDAGKTDAVKRMHDARQRQREERLLKSNNEKELP
jgi:hypothetical protein